MSSSMQHDLDHLHERELGQAKPSFNLLVSFVALLWALVHLWVASPIQYDIASSFNLQWLILNDAEIRSVHLSFGIFLVFFLFPIHKYNNALVKLLSNVQNLIFSILGGFSALYLFIFYGDIAQRIGMPSQMDTMISIMGVVMLLEASRRTVGIAITITAGIFLLYCYFGQYMPDIISHSGHSIASIASHMWLSGEGVFGTPIGVSADFIFLYVLFGTLLERTGAGNFFVQLAFSLLGKFKAGPAKAAVVSSGLMGMISGSSIANTITVGSITIPLMKKMGLSAEKAASIEVSAGVNGQVTPPIMGAAAFLIAEYLSMPYYELVKIAFLPSLLTYISLLYIVHIEGCKINMKTVVGIEQGGSMWRIVRFMLSFTSVIIVFSSFYYVVEGFNSFIGLKGIMGSNYTYAITAFLIALYTLIMWYNSKHSELDKEIDYEKPISANDVLKRGGHHFIPLIILVWCLIIEKLSPALSAFYAILFLLFTLFIDRALFSFFEGKFKCSDFKHGIHNVADVLTAGAKSMIIVAIATAVAGIIVGSISLTGVGLKITAILDYLSSSNIVITLLLTALTCIVLGMGMPTTACYIIVSTLMIPALGYFIKKHDLDVPLVSLHLFVFYFGLMADVTPPVGLASYAAAAIAHANALKTGIVAFSYNIKTMMLPFFFIFNPSILLYKVNGAMEVTFVFITSIIGILIITASTQRYLIIKNRIYETIILFVVGVGFLAPQIILNIAFPKFEELRISPDVLHEVNKSDSLRVMLEWENFSGDMERKIANINISPEKEIVQQLSEFGLEVRYNVAEHVFDISDIYQGTEAFAKIKDSNDYRIVKLYFGHKQPKDYMVYTASLLIFIAIYILQLRRKKLNA